MGWFIQIWDDLVFSTNGWLVDSGGVLGIFIKGSLDEKLPSYQVLNMLKE